VFATLQVTEEWSAQAGLVLGGDVFFDGGDPTFIGDVKWAPPNGRDSVTVSTILGSGRFNQARQLNNPNILDLVYTHKFSSRLVYSFECLGGYQNNLPNIGTATWMGIVNYLTWDFTARLSGTARLEWWDDAQGRGPASEGSTRRSRRA